MVMGFHISFDQFMIDTNLSQTKGFALVDESNNHMIMECVNPSIIQWPTTISWSGGQPPVLTAGTVICLTKFREKWRGFLV